MNALYDSDGALLMSRYVCESLIKTITSTTINTTTSATNTNTTTEANIYGRY